jgi:hypothetical protein
MQTSVEALQNAISSSASCDMPAAFTQCTPICFHSHQHHRLMFFPSCNLSQCYSVLLFAGISPHISFAFRVYFHNCIQLDGWVDSHFSRVFFFKCFFFFYLIIVRSKTLMVKIVVRKISNYCLLAAYSLTMNFKEISFSFVLVCLLSSV